MAVNLTKPPRMREYTPVHLMDEEESIRRNSRGVDVPSNAIEVVVHTDVENAPPAVVQKNDLDLSVCMDTLLNGIETADDNTQKRFANEFLKAAKKKKKALSRQKNTMFVEYILPALFRTTFSCGAMALGIFLPQIVEWSVSWLPPTYADETTWLLGVVTAIQPIFMLLGFMGGVTFFIGLLHRITQLP